MALILNTPFETPFGITVGSTYWRWVGLGVDLVTMQAVVTLRPFADEAAAFTGKSPVGPDRQYTLTGADILTVLPAEVVGALNASIYGHIKAKDVYFADAIDTESPPS